MVIHESDVKEFVDLLRAAHGSHLVSALLYGGAVEEDATAGVTGARALVVLDRIRPADLRAAQEPVRAWVEAGNPPPVYFSAEEIADASDVFPIEFLDMMAHRRVVAGRDPFEGLEVPTRNLRHQLEYELRGKLIRLRELYIPASADPVRLSALLVDSLGTFAKLFRFVLDLAGAAERRTRRETIRAAIDRFGLDPAPFDAILGALDSARPMAEAEAHACFGSYLEQIERVIDAVDRMDDDRDGPRTGETA